MRNRLIQPLAHNFLTIIFVICFAFSGFTQNTPILNIYTDGNFTQVNGANLWYEIDGNGEPLLLIAGGPGASHGYFQPFFSVLSDYFRIVYFDAFGRGKSDRAKSTIEYTFERDVDDIEGIRKALNLEKINVLGHSYGGMVAQAYALKYPNSVKRLILANSLFSAEMWQATIDNANYEIRNQYPEIWAKIEEIRIKGMHAKGKELQEILNKVPLGLTYFYNPFNADKCTLEFNPDVYYSIAGGDADFIIGGDISKLDFRTELKNLKIPTLIIAGRFDRCVLPRFAVQYKLYAPQAEFIMFEKVGHFPFVEDPEMMFEVLREFLSK
jgi:proline iminopeptidase